METLRVKAFAKLNLTLDVLGKRPDGYHDLRMVMQSVTLHDEVTLARGGAGDLALRSDLSYLPGADKNIAAVAARVFARETGADLRGLSIDLKKHIPVCAGMAGGSSDGAAVLRGLNTLYGAGLRDAALARLGEQVGSDVPYCVLGGTALAEGRGEKLTKLPGLPDCNVVLCKPKAPISTPELFRRIDGVRLRLHPDTAGMLAALEAGDLPGVARRLFNVFEQVLPPARGAEVAEIKETLIARGALGCCMSGTGPTVFGIFDDPALAEEARAVLAQRWRETYLVHPV